MAVYSSKQRKQRSIPRITFKLSAALTLITAVISVLVLVVSRALPSAGAIAFLDPYDIHNNVYAQDMARGTRLKLTNTDTVIGAFTFSPDGRQMIFTSSPEASRSPLQLYLKTVECGDLFATCGGLHELNRISWAPISPISWSPNSNQITYSSDGDIYVLTVNSGLATNITRNPAFDFYPVWSPDGSQIAFMSQSDNDHGELYIANPDGSHLWRLTNNNNSDNAPFWSPDGTHIAFIRIDANGFEDALFVPDVRDGSIRNFTPEPLADVPNSVMLPSGMFTVSDPFWSKDSSQIEFWISNRQISFLYAVDLMHDGAWRLITSQTGIEQDFRLLPDGHFVFNLTGGSDLYFLDGDQIRLLIHNAYRPVWWP